MENRSRVVLITGAGGGIGRAVVQLFAGRGWRVIGVDRAAFGDGFPGDGLFIQADISHPEAAEQIFRQARAFTTVLDALVNNAAVQVAKPLLETSVEEWDAVMASNLRSTFLFVKLAHPLLKAAGGGAVVNVSSVHAVQTSANIAAYAASKGGLLALTRAMAIEFAPDNIRANAILPGAVDTPMLRAGLDRGHVGSGDLQSRLDNLARRTVNGRVGRPEEIASAIYFLADEAQSSFMTGQAMIVDGGATARLSTEQTGCMVVLIPLTFLILFLLQMLDGIRSIGQSILRAAVILGGLIVLATEALSLAGMLDGPRLSIFWTGSLLVALGWFAWRLRGGHRLPVLHRGGRTSPAEVVLPLLALLLVGGTFCVALISPVQTYDSLSYHLSRVAHWAQNRSVAVYVTGIERQNMMGPFAEYAILHLYVLQGGDRLANLVDWSAYLGCAIAAATIAAGLGAGRLGRLLAAVSAASLPMAVAQASSTMTDIVVAFWSLCAIAEVVASKAGREADWRHWLYLAGSVGLAVLTKSTAAAFVLPFLLWFGINALLAGGLRLTTARLLAFLALVGALNGAFWLRNAQTYGTPLGSPELLRLHANQVLTPGVLVSNLVRNLSLNFGTPFPRVNEFTTSVLAKLHSLAGMNIEDPRTTYNGNFSITDQVMMEDRVGNPIHLLMLAAAGLGVLVGRRSTRLARGYALLAAATLALFSLGNTYQVFGNRLLVPFFLLSLPLIGLLAERWRAWAAAGAGVLLFLAGLPWLLSLQSRPLVPLRGQTIPSSILSMDRQDLYFANVGGLPAEQYRAVEQIRIASCTDIGLMLAGDDPEYLWWVLLDAPDDRLRIEWLVSGTPSEQFSDPDFQPCAVICTSCPQEWQSIGELPLQEQSGGLRLFLREGP